LTILSLISGLAVNRLACVSYNSTINGITVINVPFAATDVLAGVNGIPTVAGVPATAGIPADVPAADGVTDETMASRSCSWSPCCCWLLQVQATKNYRLPSMIIYIV
jgi:hypothetical protein